MMELQKLMELSHLQDVLFQYWTNTLTKPNMGREATGKYFSEKYQCGSP